MAHDPLFNEHWYRVKRLKPRLANDVSIHRHVYRSVPCYLLYRHCGNQVFRASAQMMELIGNFDGRNTVDDLWQLALEGQGDCAPTQTEFMELLGQLHEAELMIVDRRLRVEHLFSRSEDKSRSAFKQRYLNPLFMRFQLLDPDKILAQLNSKLGWLMRPSFLVVWAVVILIALLELIPHWSQFRYEMATVELLSPFYAMLFFIIYPTLKLIHEFAHGLMLKRFGGEVHEMGVALMVLLPIPYVDATTASLLASKKERIMVSAAGIVVELGFAALATLVWLNSSGVVHDAALLVMLIGGISTVIFNANPLLKFDGYYILADYLEIPNLAQRSKAYLQESLNSVLFKIEGRQEVPTDHREAGLLIIYGLLSLFYRVGLMLAIAWMISQKYFFFGFMIAVWILYTTCLVPIYKFVQFISNQRLNSRVYAMCVCAVVLFVFAVVFALIPLPYNTFNKGVVWLPEGAIVRSATDCEVTELIAQPDSMVEVGDELFYCKNPQLETSIALLQSKLDEIAARSSGLGLSKRIEQIQLANEEKAVSRSLAREQEKQLQQLLIAQSAGRFTVTDQTQLVGRFFPQGEIAAYIVTPNARTVRMAVAQNAAEIVQDSVQAVEIMFAEALDEGVRFRSQIRRQTPKAQFELPSAALSTAGGGSFMADPAGDGKTVLEPVFDLELIWPDAAPELYVGSHVYVKLYHPPNTLASRLISGVTRAFLGRVGV